MPNIPSTTQAELVAAMERFDREHRGRGRFAGWPTLADKFALVGPNGKFYPPKIVIALAANVGVNSFSGGHESTSYTDKRNLQTVAITPELREQLRAANQPPAALPGLEEV